MSCRYLPRTNAHAGDKDLLVLGSRLGLATEDLRDTSGDLADTSSAKGVAKGNGTAIDVDLVDVEAELLNTVGVHGAEGLVDLVQVDVLGCQAGTLENSARKVS